MKASENALAVARDCTKTDIECWRCRKKGHFKVDCHSKPQKKEQMDDEKGGSANLAIEGKDFTFTTISAGKILMLETSPLTGQEVDIYDLDASDHMSPSQHWFTTFREISLHAINAADKLTFQATGIGNMNIRIPNGKTSTLITLKDMLYCPNLTFTLISLTVTG